MLKFLRNCLSAFTKDILVWGSCLCNIGLCLCMAYFYVDSGFLIAPLLYAGFFAFYCLAVFFIGKRCIPVMYLIFALGAVQNITFINCTMFFILLGLSWCFPKWKIPIFVVYGLEIFVVCFRHCKTVWHLLAHVLFCVIFYFISEILKNKIRNESYAEISTNFKKLELDPKEELVVKQLAEGKMMKEVSGLSKNTRKKYLDSAMIKNNCKTKSELIAIYAIQNNMKSH